GGAFILLLGAWLIAPAGAQNATFVLSAEAPSANDLNQPFLLSTVGNDVTEAIGDYRRYCKRKQWGKAVKGFGKVGSAKPGGLVPDKDGVMVPPAVMLSRLLAELPDEGKSAFRLFHDADAKNLLERAQGKDEEANLKKVATEYLFTSSGDVAADR